MQSVKSCFNGTLFRKNLARFWPVWVLYTICWSLVLVMPPLMQKWNWVLLDANRLPLQLLGNAGILSAVVFPVLAVMCVFSYLYSSRPVGMLHSLPIRREGLFLTNYLSGLSFLILPNLALFLMALGTQTMAGGADVGSLCMWLVAQSFMCLFFYSLAVFCAMFTGHILALPVFYGVLNGVVISLVALYESLCREFLYGFYSVGTHLDTALWFTPVGKMLEHINVRANYDALGAATQYSPTSYSFEGLHIILFYALIGVVLSVIALMAYRRRQLERAGDIVSIGWVRPVFKYGVALCCAVVLGIFTYSIFFYGNGSTNGALIALMLFWGAAGYFVAEMLLRKSFWVFRKSFVGCLVFLACLMAGCAVLVLDLTGYEGRTPDAAAVESVEVTNLRSYPYDDLDGRILAFSTPEDVAQILALHQTTVAEKPLYEGKQFATAATESYSEAARYYEETYRTVGFDLHYSLVNGGTFTRSYHVVVTAAQLADPTSAAAQLNALLNEPDRAESLYFSNWRPDHKLVNATLSTVRTQNGEYTETIVERDGLEPLLAAVRADLKDGNLGRRYLLENSERMENSALSDLTLTFYVPEGGEDADPNTGRIGYDSDTRSYTIVIALQMTAKNTIPLLVEYGAIESEGSLVTHAEDQRRGDSDSEQGYAVMESTATAVLTD